MSQWSWLPFRISRGKCLDRGRIRTGMIITSWTTTRRHSLRPSRRALRKLRASSHLISLSLRMRLRARLLPSITMTKCRSRRLHRPRFTVRRSRCIQPKGALSMKFSLPNLLSSWIRPPLILGFKKGAIRCTLPSKICNTVQNHRVCLDLQPSRLRINVSTNQNSMGAEAWAPCQVALSWCLNPWNPKTDSNSITNSSKSCSNDHLSRT